MFYGDQILYKIKHSPYLEVRLFNNHCYKLLEKCDCWSCVSISIARDYFSRAKMNQFIKGAFPDIKIRCLSACVDFSITDLYRKGGGVYGLTSNGPLIICGTTIREAVEKIGDSYEYPECPLGRFWGYRP